MGLLMRWEHGTCLHDSLATKSQSRNDAHCVSDPEACHYRSMGVGACERAILHGKPLTVACMPADQYLVAAAIVITACVGPAVNVVSKAHQILQGSQLANSDMFSEHLDSLPCVCGVQLV